jgi:DNA mismatch repair ATPase MutL
VEASGRKLIRISNDGCGTNNDDALRTVERHFAFAEDVR